MPRKNSAAPFWLEWEGKSAPNHTASPEGLEVPRNGSRIVLQGDNRDGARALLDRYRGKVTLIYADPPYGVGTFFHAKDRAIGKSSAVRAYHDRRGPGEVQALYELLHLFRELLSDRGTLWLQCDWRRSAIARLLLDEVFGAERFLNHVVWSYKTGGVSPARSFARKHDDILIYSKGSQPLLKPHRQKSYVRTLPEPHTPSGRRLGVKRDDRCDLCGEGAPGQKFRWVIGRDVWDDIPSLFRNDRELVGYDTQKPERLLERIITCGTKRGDLVLDLFAGSGTTAAVAERLGRRWIVGDRSPVALRTMRLRLEKVVPAGITTIAV